MKSFVRRAFSDLLGMVFFLSSIFKLMDPVGTGLIVDSYLSFWGIEFLRPLSKWLGEALSLTEAVISMGLLTGVSRLFFARITTALTVFFTAVSIWLVAADPDMNCGCFGQALPLTHVQTLVKNLILCVCCALAFVPYRNLGTPKKHRRVAFWTGLAIVFAFALYSLLNVPLADYTEFAPSRSIVSAEASVESDGEYPTLDVWDSCGEDVSDMILEGEYAVLSFYSPDKADKSAIAKAAVFAQDALNAGLLPIVLSAGEIEVPGVDTYFCDSRKLMTLNRFNGGVTYLFDGYVVGKTSPARYMSYEEMSEHLIGKDAVEAYIKAATARSLILQGFIFVFLAVLVLV